MAIVRGHKEIEILGLACGAGIMIQGICATDEKRYVGFLQRRECPASKTRATATQQSSGISEGIHWVTP
jgi:hypothetical protein